MKIQSVYCRKINNRPTKPMSIQVITKDENGNIDKNFYRHPEYREYCEFVKTFGSEFDTENDKYLKMKVKNNGSMKGFVDKIPSNIYMPKPGKRELMK